VLPESANLVAVLFNFALVYETMVQLEAQNEDWARLKSGELPLKASQVFLPKGEGERHARSLEDVRFTIFVLLFCFPLLISSLSLRRRLELSGNV
jgi:hypothetical protein